MLIFLVAGVLAAPAPPAWACSCAEIDALQSADLAFTGRVVSIGTDAQGVRRVEFAVESVRKGSAGTSVTLTTSASSASCGFDFAAGHRYRVFARSGRTGLCSGTEQIPGLGLPAGDRVSLAPAITEPRPGVDAGPSTLSPALWAPVGIGMLVLAGTAVFVVRQRRPK